MVGRQWTPSLLTGKIRAVSVLNDKKEDGPHPFPHPSDFAVAVLYVKRPGAPRRTDPE